MSCKYSDIDGKCTMYDEGVEQPGCDDDGTCICQDDPDPTYLCEDYEEGR